MTLEQAQSLEPTMIEAPAFLTRANGICRQMTVLVIEHEAETAGRLTQVLQAAGHLCHIAAGAEAAFESVSASAPDLIISDINLAGHSGVSLCERLKQNGGLDDVPVMFLSGTQIPDIIRRGHSAGGTYYLRKPCDPEVLLSLIDKALRQRVMPGPFVSN